MGYKNYGREGYGRMILLIDLIRLDFALILAIIIVIVYIFQLLKERRDNG